jgi:hypothetical protein
MSEGKTGEGLLEKIGEYMNRHKSEIFLGTFAGGTALGYFGLPRIVEGVRKKVYDMAEDHKKAEMEREERQAKLAAKYLAEELRKSKPGGEG